MPELPDVETFQKYFRRHALNKTIRGVDILTAKVVEGASKKKAVSRLRGKKITATRRRGKNLFVKLQGGAWLHIHFGMTGTVASFKAGEAEPKYSRVILRLSGGSSIAYISRRMLGGLSFAASWKDVVRDKGLGPDAKDLSFEDFRDVFSGSKKTVKAALMDQSALAGIGNVYSDEILFQSRVHPASVPDHLRRDKIKTIYNKMQHVLKTAIRKKADPRKLPDSWLTPVRGQDGKCPHGHGVLKTGRISGRTSYFCPTCQKKY